ncbi:Cystinosin [Schistosoma japonicum]|nr:Cystinosin [Schistosoma japonicum]KAH8873631.1 Cystinosin [Schistosoma japonicum]KAH8873632.1 Cystinosin [Schistosoma japonicum]
MLSSLQIVCLLLSAVLKIVQSERALKVYFKPKSVNLQLGENETIFIGLNDTTEINVNLEVQYWNQNSALISLEDVKNFAIHPINNVIIQKDQKGPSRTIVYANKPGHIYLGIKSVPNIHIVNADKPITPVSVIHYHWLYILQVVIGWLYFAAWTVSFYPQLFLNCKRKSVVGFNFDFAVLNVIGFFYYSIYNIGLFWIPLIQQQYLQRHPLGSVPVLLNDLVFAFHAFFISLLTALQILFYERGGQQVSKTCIGIIILIIIYSVIVCILGGANVTEWLDTLYLLSYVKLFISFIKYTPQALMNFRRKSTVGWSIGNIILDFSGGILSIAQMVIIAYNNNDVSSITGSPIKLGLGILSIGFDILFMVQHWCLYPSSSSSSNSSSNALTSSKCEVIDPEIDEAK